MAVQLTADQAAELNSYSTAIKALQGDIARAKRAGLNTAILEQNLSQIDSVRRGLLREFAPSTVKA